MKFHFLCEGQYGKAEYIFILAVISEFRTNEDFVLVSSNGNENIEKEFLKLKTTFSDGDIFILFFDNIETIKGRLVIDLLNDIERQCNSKKVFFRYTTYYCFEEIFLSYINLLSVLNVNESIKTEVIKIQKMLLSGTNYFKNDISFWERHFSPHRKGCLRTREQLSSSICNFILETATGSFHLQKNKIGSCWISNCRASVLHKSVCDKCKYKLKGYDFKDKLHDLDCNSVSSFNLPFSSIFDN